MTNAGTRHPSSICKQGSKSIFVFGTFTFLTLQAKTRARKSLRHQGWHLPTQRQGLVSPHPPQHHLLRLYNPTRLHNLARLLRLPKRLHLANPCKPLLHLRLLLQHRLPFHPRILLHPRLLLQLNPLLLHLRSQHLQSLLHKRVSDSTLCHEEIPTSVCRKL
jgi:hypothetical protein